MKCFSGNVPKHEIRPTELPDPWTTSSLDRRLASEVISRSPLVSDAAGDFSNHQVSLSLCWRFPMHEALQAIIFYEPDRAVWETSKRFGDFPYERAIWHNWVSSVAYWPVIVFAGYSRLWGRMTSERHFSDLARSRQVSFWRLAVDWA